MILGVLLLSLSVLLTRAQPSTNATCSPNFDWSFNSLNQSPCLVAAYAASACDDGLFFIQGLTSDLDFYTPPTVAQVNQCACSSVFYSLLSACADCQGGKVLTWSTFNVNCQTVYPSVYLPAIPAGTAFPHWAYQNVSAPGAGFNATLAELQLNAPESTANASPTSTTLPSGTAVIPSSRKKSNAGPIAGGVVGGVVLISLVCIAVFWFMRRRRRGNAPSNIVGTPMGYHPTGTTAMGDITPFATPTPKVLYNPSDPSTFPSSPSSGMYASARVQSPQFSSENHHPTDLSLPQYTGAPEI